MATLISEFDDPPGAAQRPEEPPAVDLAAAAATGDVEALRRAFEAQLAAQEQRHAAELRAAALGDAKVPLLGATKRLLAEADAMRASRNQGADDGSDEAPGSASDKRSPGRSAPQSSPLADGPRQSGEEHDDKMRDADAPELAAPPPDSQDQAGLISTVAALPLAAAQPLVAGSVTTVTPLQVCKSREGSVHAPESLTSSRNNSVHGGASVSTLCSRSTAHCTTVA